MAVAMLITHTGQKQDLVLMGTMSPLEPGHLVQS